MRLLLLLPALVLAGCAMSEAERQAEADQAAMRQASMSGPSLTWEELHVHPTVIRHACSISTLVNTNGQVVGYCRAGRQCRTMDWHPVAPGCVDPQLRQASAPARTAALDTGR
ncbi:hypothetical protein [Belnapia rosea]|uniref:Hemolysin n=1 Tax=Belnapia rosea TaxID=938405 RepID=A0A1G6SVU2_9PROT|nr:hypothetical protein [Belnapia rosea]SDB60342.1 hypothetical protein SAMN02927895_02379 [Belnapia rosea]SDD20992.1 hypothetical protein SAMN04487779_1005183 [Belnapia rosea]